MAHSFIAYIDESGDEGLGNYREPGRQGGASHWLTIGAAIWRQSRDLDAVRWTKGIIDQLPQQKRLHFTKLDHPQKVMAIQSFCDKPLRFICVIANKPIIPEGTYVEPNQLYHYMCRYLIERISWLCRDYRPDVPEGDGRVKIVFSRRGKMVYQDFKDYLEKLRAFDDPDIQIHWPVIDIAGIEAHDHSTRYGLQLADLGISGLAAGLEPDLYGNCELRYAEMLKPVVYSRKGNFLSYGAKIVPAVDKLEFSAQQQRFVKLFGG